MRKENNHRSELVSQLLYGDCFKIIGKKKEWFQIITLLDNYNGWIDQKQGLIIDESIAKKVGVENPKCTTQLIDYIETQNKDLIALVLGSNVSGASILKHKYKGPAMVGKKEKSNLLKSASLYLNAPYLWGGKTPMGIDCSGLTQMMYRINGYKIPRDASEQSLLGETLSFIDESEPGDLAFFDDEEGNIIHVGLLLQNHHILHAHGKVRIDRIDQTGIYNIESQKHSHKLRIIKKII
jgi:cell wall-associated NlpC family hydrolase|tara:strand:- start:833 stop:1546 length:714 start_codon:yes stop_codon:yes gene_type:complete